MKKLQYTLLLLFFAIQTHASHVVGSEMNYRYTGVAGIYEITAKIYVDCSGVPLCANCPTSLSSNCSITLNLTGATPPVGSQVSTNPQAGNNFGTLLLKVDTIVGIYNPVQLCNNARTICSNCGTRTPGTYAPGIEVYTFRGTLNTNLLPANNTWLGLSYSNCCRSPLITTLKNPSSLNFFTEVYINTEQHLPNSSPYFVTDPVIDVVKGVDVYNNVGAVDPDGDMLTYYLAPSYSNPGIAAPYVSPYSPAVPFPYLGAPIQSPPALPPIGIYMDSKDGSLIFRPMDVFVSNLVIGVIQWRKINGVNTMMGVTFRDVQIHSKDAPYTSNPRLISHDTNGVGYPFISSYAVKPNETLCFILTANSQTQPLDTTDIYIRFEPSLLFTNISAAPLYNPATRATTGPVYDSIKVCWTPPTGAARSYPYYLYAEAFDRACPVKRKTVRAIAIQVIDTAATGVKENNQKAITDKWSIYPNPNKGNFTLATELRNAKETDLQVVNMLGAVVWQQKKNFAAGQQNYDIQTPLTPGIYFLEIRSGKEKQVLKFVVE